MWAFYRGETDQCATKLASVHDASASLRHQLHRKLGGAVEDQMMMDNPGGGVGGGGGTPPASATGATTASLLEDSALQYSSPVVVSTGSVLRPTPQVRRGLWGSGGVASGARV